MSFLLDLARERLEATVSKMTDLEMYASCMEHGVETLE